MTVFGITANQSHRYLVQGFGGRISAALVWDGTDEVRIPPPMGEPSEGQMTGTARERLVELAGRVCYDSLGTGRKSRDYHGNIIKINHGALHEHAYLTSEFVMRDGAAAMYLMTYFLNKPSLWVEHRSTPTLSGDNDHRIRATLNLRHIREWEGKEGSLSAQRYAVWTLLREASQELAPVILPGLLGTPEVQAAAELLGVEAVHPDEPETDEEKWITLYVTGSRGWSHELVRHGDWTAISQRSTRYVDESESQWVVHPLISKFIEEGADEKDVGLEGPRLRDIMEETYGGCKDSYDILVSRLQPWLEAKGIDKFSARKQARGAARGLLGNALETEVIFSASVAQWRHMLNMRASDAADAEIRLGFAEAVLPCLKESRYGDRFGEFELAPSKDGIGRSLVGGGHK